MKLSANKKNESVSVVLRRMRESAGLTMRQVGAMMAVSHVTISQFENGKLDLPHFRIEQMVQAYGLKMSDFSKIIGWSPVCNVREECAQLVDKLGDGQLALLRPIMIELTRVQAKTGVDHE